MKSNPPKTVTRPPLNAPQPTPYPAAEAAARLLQARLGEARTNAGWWGTYILFRKEMARFLAILGQTIISPVITTVLWFLVFGFSLGERLQDIRGIPYVDFLVPGLIMMAVMSNAFINSSFSFLITKVHGSVVDILITPLSPNQIILAYTGAAMVRACLVGSVIWVAAALMGAGTLYHPGWSLLFLLLTSAAFGIAGLLTGILAREFDHVNFIPNFLLVPLSFLGGVFYSVRLLPEPWDNVSLFNPIVYMVNGLRYGMTGMSDVSLILGLALTFTAILAGWATTYVILRKGWRLRT
ncbi:MAG: ABC transporter permease [Opitutales bacterium]|nr:ABC transporter permease [Opitutales bacterium]